MDFFTDDTAIHNSLANAVTVVRVLRKVHRRDWCVLCDTVTILVMRVGTRREYPVRRDPD